MRRTANRLSAAERGSALVEAAIVLPCLVLLLHCSVALTELLLVHLKAAEAARRALWETTAGRTPAAVEESASGLWTSRPLRFRASFETRPASRILNPAQISGSDQVAGDATGAFGFPSSSAAVRVHLDSVPLPRWLLPGGDLPWRRGAGDFARPSAIGGVDAPVRSAAPLRIVVDTWRAWPPSGADPGQTYPIVERQVSERVGKIAFSGLRSRPFLAGAFAGSLSRAALGGRPPAIFAPGPFDDGGPITILPPGPPDAPFVPNACGRHGSCANTRVGDVLSSDRPARLGGAEAFSEGEDSPRATVPFRVHGLYWKRSGGSDGDRGAATEPIPARLGERNGYVTSWQCRGHYFAGSVRAEEADVHRRYREPCR